MNHHSSSFLPRAPASSHLRLALAGEDRHGYGIMQEVARPSEGRYQLGPGMLYENLQPIEGTGPRGGGRPPRGPGSRWRYYRLNFLGRGVLSAEIGRLEIVVRPEGA